MAEAPDITIQSKFGRRLGSDSAELVYLIRQTDQEALALAALQGQAPAIYQGMPRKTTEVDEIEGLPGGGWIGSARYAFGSGAQQVGDTSFSFNTTGATAHVQASLETVSAYGEGASTADNGKLIRATADGVEGAEIVTPVYQWAESHLFDPANVDGAFKGTLYALTAAVNNAAFKGTAAGETLFKGATGRQRGDQPWEITFNFASKPNRTNLSYGDISGVSAKGWDYVWVRSRTAKAGSLGLLVQKPVAVYVERNYKSADFAALGIGT